jgi:hypothetical protein
LPRNPTRPLLSRILLLIVTSVIALGAAEVLFRWYASRTFARKMPAWTENLVVVRGPQVFAFKPHATGVFPGNIDSKHTFPYRTNGEGLRESRSTPQAPRHEARARDGRFVHLGIRGRGRGSLPAGRERLLAERGRSDIEVINGGIPDFNSRQERRLLEQLISVYQPDAVFLGYVVNDGRNRARAMPRPPEEEYRHSTSWFLTEVAERLNRRLFRRRVLPSSKDHPG